MGPRMGSSPQFVTIDGIPMVPMPMDLLPSPFISDGNDRTYYGTYPHICQPLLPSHDVLPPVPFERGPSKNKIKPARNYRIALSVTPSPARHRAYHDYLDYTPSYRMYSRAPPGPPRPPRGTYTRRGPVRQNRIAYDTMSRFDRHDRDHGRMGRGRGRSRRRGSGKAVRHRLRRR